MKKLLIFLLFITCYAYGQDTLSYMYDAPLYIPGEKSLFKTLDIGLRKVRVQDVMMGKDAVYVPETDVQQGNSKNQKSRIITYQIAMSDQVTEEQKAKIKQAIDGILYGGGVIVDPPPLPVDIIDTVDADAAVFSAGWTKATSRTANWYDETLSFSNVPGATATYKHPVAFKRVEIWAERKNTHGFVTISVGGEEQTIDLYNPTYQIPYLVHFFDVPLGVYEIKYTVTGNKNPASSNSYGLLDYFRFFR